MFSATEFNQRGSALFLFLGPVCDFLAVDAESTRESLPGKKFPVPLVNPYEFFLISIQWNASGKTTEKNLDQC